MLSEWLRGVLIIGIICCSRNFFSRTVNELQSATNSIDATSSPPEQFTLFIAFDDEEITNGEKNQSLLIHIERAIGWKNIYSSKWHENGITAILENENGYHYQTSINKYYMSVASQSTNI